MCKRILFSVAVSLFLVFPVSAYQSPGSPAGFVNDFSGILSADAKARLEEKLTGFAAQESNEISVVTISSLDGDTIENYAVNLFAEWQIGRAKQDNGVLLLVAPNERKAVFISALFFFSLLLKPLFILSVERQNHRLFGRAR